MTVAGLFGGGEFRQLGHGAVGQAGGAQGGVGQTRGRAEAAGDGDAHGGIGGGGEPVVGAWTVGC
jgi:hypothetical protein